MAKLRNFFGMGAKVISLFGKIITKSSLRPRSQNYRRKQALNLLCGVAAAVEIIRLLPTSILPR